jgi:hypothetical protein
MSRRRQGDATPSAGVPSGGNLILRQPDGLGGGARDASENLPLSRGAARTPQALEANLGAALGAFGADEAAGAGPERPKRAVAQLGVAFGGLSRIEREEQLAALGAFQGACLIATAKSPTGRVPAAPLGHRSRSISVTPSKQTSCGRSSSCNRWCWRPRKISERGGSAPAAAATRAAAGSACPSLFTAAG